MKKIIEFLQLQFKKFAPTVVLPIVIVLFAIIAADLLYQPKKMVKRGFQVEVAADGKAVLKKEEKPADLASLISLADIDRGTKIFKKCASCKDEAFGLTS